MLLDTPPRAAEATRPIYLFVVDSKSLVSKAIKAVTGQPYSHICITLDKSLDKMYGFNRKGFIHESIKDYPPDSYFSLYKMEVPLTTFNNLKSRLGGMYKNRERYEYNFLGAGSIALGKEAAEKGKFFCSEFIGHLLQQCNLLGLKKSIHKLTPSDIVKSKSWKFVYKGYVAGYNSLKLREGGFLL